MCRSTAIIAIVLALLTGLVLGQLSSLTVARFQTSSSRAAASAEDLDTAQTFYEQINHFLATGERDVASMLSLDFVDYSGSQPRDRDSESFMNDLASVRSLLPQLRFEIVGLQAWGSLVAVHLEVGPGSAVASLAVPLVAPADISVDEFLRIERGKVVERWGSDDRLPALAWTLSTDFDRTGPRLSGPVIQRFSVPAGQEIALTGKDSAVLRVVSGELQPDRVTVDPRRGELPTSDPIGVGQLRIVTITDTLVLRNRSNAATEFLAFSLYGLYPVDTAASSAGDSATEPGVEVADLTYMPLQMTAPLGQRLRLSVTEVTLPVGATVALHAPGVVEEVVVLDGALEVSVQDGRALISTGDGQARLFDGIETVSAGQGISTSSIASVGYLVVSAHPATLLIMTIETVPSTNSAEGS